jgi:hypothetical protein
LPRQEKNLYGAENVKILNIFLVKRFILILHFDKEKSFTQATITGKEPLKRRKGEYALPE